jgi:predicted ATPase/DNA-binding SARP family transcriptional activator
MSNHASSPTEQTAGPSTETLRIHLLGPPSVEWAGRRLPIPRRQARALLCRLAVRSQPIAREQLCYLFWPDIPDTTARRHLSHLLWHLQRALPDALLVLATKDSIGLDPMRIWSDVAAFERLCAVGTTEALQQVVELYRGPFLSGFSLPGCPEFESWATGEGQTLELRYLRALATLLEERAARGEHQAAIACAQRYLSTDDLAEGLHRRLIELYALTGDRSAALRQYERCAVILERELGVSPLPETRAAYESALQGRPPLSPPQEAGPPRIVLPGVQVPLLGRQDALRHLEQAWIGAQRGKGSVALIRGEAGIGKSRLMYEFAEQRGEGTLVLTGTCHSVTRSVPYHPLVDALRPVAGTVTEKGEKAAGSQAASRAPLPLSPIWLAEVARLLPELRGLYPDLPPPLPTEPEEARARLFEALGRLVLALAAGPAPLLLALDDLHWADGATLDWLGYLAYQLRHSHHFGLEAPRLLVVGAYRSEEGEILAELRRGLARAGAPVELELAGLDAVAVRQLVAYLTSSSLLADDPDQVLLADRLQEATGGNPFFLLETVQAYLEAGHPARDYTALARFPLPDTIRLAVDRRLKRLSPQARQVLEAGAVLGRAFGFDLVRVTAGRGEMEVLDGLEELVARQFLREGESGFGFRHDLIRRAVAEDLSPVRRQLLHRRAGRALEKLRPEAVSSLALHFELGGEKGKALHYHGLAAQRSEALFAWNEAEQHQDRMLALLAELDPACTQPDCLAQRGQILATRAHLYYLQGRLADRDADLASLEELSSDGGHAPLRLCALQERVRYLNLDGHYEQGIAVAQEGLALAGSLGEVAASSRLLAQLGFAHYFLGQPRRALAALESALAAAGGEADAAMRGRISHILGYVHFHLGDYARSLACQQEAYACHQQTGDHNRLAWDGLDIGAALFEMGEVEEAGRYLDEHLALARRIGARPAEAYALTLLGSWNLHRGDYGRSADYFLQAFAMQSELRSEQGCAAADEGLGLALYHLGELAEARRRLQGAASRARALGHRRRLVEALVGLGLVEIAADRLDDAQQYLHEAVPLAREAECYEPLAAGLAALARAARLAWHLDLALADAEEAVRVAQASRLPVCEIWGRLEAGLARLARGEAQAALALTEQAVALLPRANQAWIGTEEVHLAHARVLQALGQVQAAGEHLRLAEVCVAQKADLIADPDQRRRYLSFARRVLLA